MKSTIFLAVLFVGVCFVSSAVGVGQVVQEHTFLASAELATGTVTRSQVDSSGKAVEFCPIVEFTTQAGQPVAFESDICKSHPNQVQIGQKQVVYYDPHDPKNVQRRDSNLFLQYLDISGFPFLFGLLFLGIALLMVVGTALTARRRRMKFPITSGAGAVPNKSASWDEYLKEKNEQTVREVEARRKQQGK